MAKRKPSKKRPQAQHSKKGQKSQYDKRQRLLKQNKNRKVTSEARVPLYGAMQVSVAALQALLDPRIAFRLGIIFAGMLLADDLRTASAWFAAGGVQDDWDRFYDCLISVGKRFEVLSFAVLGLIVKRLDPGPDGVVKIAMDDTVTRRFGPQVEGTGVHHNPTPGPADGDWMYGHNWVTLAWLARHPIWGVIALPILSKLYVRRVDIPKLNDKYGWEFKTKLELGLEQLKWFVSSIRQLGVTARVWLAVDGAYAKKSFLRPLILQGLVVYSRLRRDACLYDVPPSPKAGKRGRPRIYGKNKISLSKRANNRRGWTKITYLCRGSKVTRQYKSFLATTHLTGGVIRVVIVKFDNGWAAYFSTDANVSVENILEMVADRWAIEEHFHDVKEVCGAGQQQVRNVWSNIACWHLNAWLFTMVELCSWDKPHEELSDRTDRPWDNPARRPSHNDRRRTIAKEMLRNHFFSVLRSYLIPPKIQAVLTDLIALSA